ncbi:MAG: hypothetical protein DI629_00250 [Mesorhizobium amorphae]|nr:MAG: hypothetical protein DI629_00250 [Mesorhizobium amorphae]
MNAQADMDRERLSKGIRRQIGGDQNKRFLRGLPCFRTSEALPESMRELLKRLDEREGNRSRSHH